MTWLTWPSMHVSIVDPGPACKHSKSAALIDHPCRPPMGLHPNSPAWRSQMFTTWAPKGKLQNINLKVELPVDDAGSFSETGPSTCWNLKRNHPQVEKSPTSDLLKVQHKQQQNPERSGRSNQIKQVPATPRPTILKWLAINWTMIPNLYIIGNGSR